MIRERGEGVCRGQSGNSSFDFQKGQGHSTQVSTRSDLLVGDRSWTNQE